MHDGTFASTTTAKSFNLSTKALADQELLRCKAQQIAAEMTEFTRRDVPTDIAAAEIEAAATEENLRTIVTAGEYNLRELHAPRNEKAKEAAFAKFAYRTNRDAIEPDVFWVIVVGALLVAIETGATAMVLAGDGAMSGPGAVLFGLVFGLANVAVAQLAGFFGLRNALYRLRPEIEAEDGKPQSARRFGWTLFLCLVMVLGVLIFSAARVRALGSHHDVFNFGVLGFWQTYDDSPALMIVAIGVSAAILNIAKGRSGWDEPLPGFKDAFTPSWRIDGEADDRADAALEDLDKVLENALDTLDATRSELDDLLSTLTGEAEAITLKAKAHNAEVANAADREVRRQRSLNTARYEIAGTELLDEGPLRASFDALRLPELDEALLRDRLANARGLVIRLDALMADLNAEHSRHAAAIEAAHGTYCAHAVRADMTLNWD